MRKLLMIILIFAGAAVLGALLLTESAEFRAAEADWSAAKADFDAARVRGDHKEMVSAFKREQAAMQREIETCRWCSKDNPRFRAILEAKPPE
jgi:hypothetical protein